MIFFFGVLVKEKMGLFFVVIVYGSDLENIFKLFLGRFYVMRSLKRVDVVIVVSYYLVRFVKIFGVENVKVIFNGFFEFEGFEGGKREYVIFIGVFWDYKFFEMFVEFVKFFFNIEFFVVGDGFFRKRFEVKVLLNVYFFGYCMDVEEILSRSILLVFFFKREGFGFVIFEVNFFGVFVIGRWVSVILEFIREGKNGLMFISFDDFVDEVRVFLESLKIVRKMGLMGKCVVEKYFWEKVVEEVEWVYLFFVG